MRLFKTVLGDISESDLGATLVHEHICCYSEYAYRMAGKDYLDKDALADTATGYLKELKKKYGLATFVDCTPINIYNISSDYYGAYLGIDNDDNECGKLTFVNYIINADASSTELYFNIRYGLGITQDQIRERLTTEFGQRGFELEFLDTSNPHIVPKDHPMLLAMMDVYAKYSGHTDGVMYVNAGGTYGQLLPCAAEIGTSLNGGKRPFDLPAGHGSVHQPDECISIDGLLNAIESQKATCNRQTRLGANPNDPHS